VDAGSGRGAYHPPVRHVLHAAGTSYLLRRGRVYSQVAAHRAAERGEDAIAAWRSQTWARHEAIGGRGVDLLRGRVRASAAGGSAQHFTIYR
jgi:hypothetical protein